MSGQRQVLAVRATKSLTSIAKSIRQEHKLVAESAATSLEHAIECGRLLDEAKRLVEHGDWLRWVEDKCEISERTVRQYSRLFRNQQQIAMNRHSGADLTLHGAEKLLSVQKQDNKQQRKQDKADRKAAVPEDLPPLPDRCTLIHSDLGSVNGDIESGSVDWIITDPPYPKEFLPVYDKLSDFAARVLKPGGSVLAMVGQSYLPEIMQRLSKSLSYHWTLAYLTPGGQAVQLWDREVNTFWKPVLWYVKGEYAGDWVGDVCKSDVNDNDKDHHHWGQSESGMADLIERFTYPGQTICDPFLGGGTTGVVALAKNRRFIGIDIEKTCVDGAETRIREMVSENAPA